MNSGKYVFAQILQYVNGYGFGKWVERYDGDHRGRYPNCWNPFVRLFFGQLTTRNPLRDIATCLKAHKSMLYHISQVRCLYAEKPILGIKLENEVFALDPATISLGPLLFQWGAVKIHTLLDLRGSIPSFVLVTYVLDWNFVSV